MYVGSSYIQNSKIMNLSLISFLLNLMGKSQFLCCFKIKTGFVAFIAVSQSIAFNVIRTGALETQVGSPFSS